VSFGISDLIDFSETGFTISVSAHGKTSQFWAAPLIISTFWDLSYI
jgi:hypothetical protein